MKRNRYRTDPVVIAKSTLTFFMRQALFLLLIFMCVVPWAYLFDMPVTLSQCLIISVACLWLAITFILTIAVIAAWQDDTPLLKSEKLAIVVAEVQLTVFCALVVMITHCC